MTANVQSTPLHDAVRSGDIEECRRLIGTGVDIDTKDNKKRTALHIAAWKGDASMVKLLLRSRCSPMEKALDGFTALHFAAMSESVEACELLALKQRSLLKDRVTKGNKTALHLAIGKGNLDIVQKMLDLGSDVTAKQGNGKNVLELANTDAMYRLLKTSFEAHLEKLRTRGAGPGPKSDYTPAEENVVEEVAVGVGADASDHSGTSDATCMAVEAPIIGAAPAALPAIPEPPVPAAAPPVNKKKRKLVVAHLEFDDEDD